MSSHMRICAFVILACGLSACGDPDIFARVNPPESEGVADAAYPRLADTPATPPLGTYTAAAPDPATGDAVFIELSAEAEIQETRRKKIAGPVE